MKHADVQQMSFTAKTVAERTRPGQRQDVEEQREPTEQSIPPNTFGHANTHQNTPSTSTAEQKASAAS